MSPKPERVDESEHCVLYADPRLEDDLETITVFRESELYGTTIPTSASAGLPELFCGTDILTGHDAIVDYLRTRRKSYGR